MRSLQELEAQLQLLVAQRMTTISAARADIDAAHRRIREANRKFDAKSISLHRQIQKLTPPDPPKASVTHGPINTAGLTPDEAAHFQALLAKG